MVACGEVAGKPIVDNCIAGYNSSVFAYGQTGSGKTYTMLGSLAEDNSSEASRLEDAGRGLIPRVFEQLFAAIKEVRTKPWDISLVCLSEVEDFSDVEASTLTS